jgi:predicted ATPase
MATDLETKTEPGEPILARPSLKITGLHIRGLKSIGSLDLPGDGLGWDGPIPDMVMVGGVNGSGKTTLLEFLVGAFHHLANNALRIGSIESVAPDLRAVEARLDFRVEMPSFEEATIRFLIGSQFFIGANAQGNWCGIVYGSQGPDLGTITGVRTSFLDLFLHRVGLRPQFFSDAFPPSVVYFPSGNRTLIIPATNYKSAGKLIDNIPFIDRWRPPENWDSSLEARLYGLRWQYLNAREEGRLDEPNGFDAYAKAFDRFFEGRKRLRWTPKGELVVETKSGDIHDLAELSSGEKQVILFMGELLHRWRPGSLILIDEPELHLHESYQTRLWQSLVDWQKERGGQVIIATQSDHLFGISDPGIKVLLSVRRGR